MSYVLHLIDKYKSKGLFLDSNLLLFYLVGSVAPYLVENGQYKKLTMFQREQIGILNLLIKQFTCLVTTAHVLTEVSNLLNDLNPTAKQVILTSFVATLETIPEQQLSSYSVACRDDFKFLGLTDSVLAELSKQYLVVSNDARMVDMLRLSGIEALKWVEILGLTAQSS